MTRIGVSVSRRGICALLAPAAALLGIVCALGGCSAPGESGVTEDQLISDLSAVAELTDVPVSDALYEYVDPSAWEAGEATFEQSGSDDGTVSVRATVPVSNDSYAAEERLSATYVKDDDGTWTGSWQVESVDGLRAVSGVQHDERRWNSGSARIEFDEESQTCTVYAPYEDPAWFETAEGDLAYDYAFDGSAWVFEGVDESSSSVTYENLVGVYDIEDEGGECVTSLEITDVAADGTITARVSWRLDQPRLIYLTLFAPEDAATLTGKLVSAPSEEGRHRVIANLSGTTDTEGLPAAMSILADSDPVGLSGGDTEIEYNLIVEAQTKNRNRGTVDDLYSYQLGDYASLLTDEKLSKDAVSGE